MEKAIESSPRCPGEKRILPALLLVLGLLAITIPPLYGVDNGYKFIRNYSDLEYDNQPQNWGMVQAEDGILYFANLGGVLEYDGETWRVHYMEGRAMHSLAMDESGTIFVGGDDGDIWRLTPDSNGTMKFFSLLEHLDEEHKKFGEVWSTHSIKNKVYFRTSEQLFIWDKKKMITLKPDGKFKASFVHNGELIVQEDKRGLLKLVKNELQPIPGGEFFTGKHGKRISVFTPFSDKPGDGTILVGNREPGFFLYKGGKITPFSTEAIDHLKEYKLNHGIRLDSGEFALATGKGLVIIGPGGELKTVIDITNGLQDDAIKYVFQDKWGNLWLCMDIGISKIEYHSQFSFIDNNSSMPGLTMTAVRHKNRLYVGTTRGVFYKTDGSQLTRVPGINVTCNSLVSSGGRLLAATDAGVFWLDNDRPVRILEDQTFSLSASKRFPGVTWCGTSGNLAALEYSGGQWRERFRSGSELFYYQIHSMAEESDGGLWLGTGSENVFRVRFPNGPLQPEITPFDSRQGLKGNESYVAEAAGRVLFATSNGLYKFNGKSNTFSPDPLLGEEFADGEKSKPVFRIARGWDGQIWFNSESRNYLAVPKGKGRFEIIKRPFTRMPPIQTNAIYPDRERKTTWFATHDGLYGYDTTMKKDYKQSFTTLIRKVILNEGSKDQLELFNDTPGETIDAAALPVPQIPFENRNIYFEYAAPFFEAESETRYKCFLEGYDSDWTALSKENKKYYTNLEPGLYRFRVRAENVYGTRGREAEYRFRILSPWYRTWLMFLLYGIFMIFSIYRVILWRSRKLLREKQRLEDTVKERTREIDEKNRQLERQTLRLQAQSEKLKEMDNVKSRFFANISHEFRTPLTLILGPLEQMYSAADEEKEKKKIGTILRNSQRLLNLINQLLDLSRLDSGKEKLQTADREIVPFLKGIIANFEAAAEQKELNLALQADAEDISFYFDSQKMEKVMNNLLMNAVKYTPPNGSIAVSVSKTGRERETKAGPGEFVNISVKDSGAGIPPDQIDNIFDRFFQAERLKTRNGEGTGIGLALVKEYVELHHGKVDVHSLEGKGTEFVLRFPTGKDHLEPGQVTGETGTAELTVRPYKEFETAFEIEDTGEIENVGDIRTHDDAEGSQKPVILVVEDNTDVRRYIREPLETDYSVVEAADGEEGIEKAKALIPDLIVSDIMMPGKDGYELCRTLKTDIRTSHIPIVLLTAKASEGSVVQGLETGADDYITKPFNTHILLARIRNLVELRRHLQLKIQKQMLLQPDEINVSSMDREFIDQLKKAIYKHKSDPGFGVEKLSELIYMDRTTLYRKIKALIGETPQLFIRSFRLQIAVKLLKGRAGTVSQVASEVGFDNVAYFAKCFKEKYNILPSSFMAAESTKIENNEK